MVDVDSEVVNISGTIEQSKTHFPSKSFFQLPSSFESGTSAAKEWIGHRRENVRPWTTFLNSNNFKSPASLARLRKRLLKNVEYFQSNYIFMFMVLLLVSVFFSWRLLLASGVTLYAIYKVSTRSRKQVSLLGCELSVAHQYCLVLLLSIPLYLWAGASSVLFWVLGVTVFFVSLHAAFFNIEAVLSSEEETFDLEEV